MKKVRIPVPRTPGIYRIKYRDKGGNLHDPTKGFPFEVRFSVRVNGKSVTRSHSCETLHQAKSIRSNGLPKPEKVSSGYTFGEAVKLWKRNHLSSLARATCNMYERRVQHLDFFLQFEVEEIGPKEVFDWLNLVRSKEYLKGQKSTRASYRHEWIALRGILGHYKDTINTGYVLPFIKGHRKLLKVRETVKREKDLSLAEFQAFAAELKKECADKEAIYYMALFQYGTYARIQEAAAFHYEDFDLANGVVHVHRKVEWARRRGQEILVSKGSKANQGKVVPLNPFLRKAFKEWTMKSGHRKGLMFRMDGGVITYRRIQHAYDKALKAAGIEFTGTHLLRHASLTEAYHQSKDIKTTAHLAGHASIVTTQRYAHARDEKARETQERMSRELMNALG